MEKKGNRLVQPLLKGTGTDTKKIQDVVKPWSRGGRRREPNGGAFPKLGESSRKPLPQRNKFMDKRPQPRGNHYSGIVGGKEEPGIEPELGAELGSVFLQGSKKQSLNHLLNFHFESREGLEHVSSTLVKTRYRWNSISKHKYNKEQFLQANCQFVVKESGDYKAYMNNPDALVDWNLIEQVNLEVLEFPSCPICLYPPVAAKMTRCGHIYCWSCLLHYLALSDKTWRKCPICFEAVHKNDLKSVCTVPHTPFNINDEITFKLMKRHRGSLITYPADYDVHEDTILNMSDKNTADVYSKLLLAGKAEVASIIEREQIQLLTLLAEDENCPERCFIEQALALLHERETGMVYIYDNQTNDNCEIIADVANGNVRDNNAVGNVETPSELASKKWHYFYQASDGQHIYLHTLNVRMLEYTYGSLENSPIILTGRIVEKESGSMTDDLRKRLRCLQHLPVTCQFEVAEIILAPPVVSPDALHYFHEQIETRRKRRQRRARDEKRREKKIIEEENKKIGKYPVPNIKLESQYQFPDFQSIAESEDVDTSLPCVNASSGSSVGSLDKENEYTGLSFAKMLSANNSSSSQAWPTRKGTSGDEIKIANIDSVRARMDNDVDIEGYIPVPEFNQSFGDAIALALEKAVLNDTDGLQNIPGKKKKKNKEKKILFATSMGYCNK